MPDLSMFVDDLEAREYAAGHVFFSAGESGDQMFIVLKGEAEITLNGKLLETVGAGGVFGEMTLVDHHERSADVTAKVDTTIATIDQKRFLYLIRNHPFFAIEIMKVMTERLRNFDRLL